MTDTLLKNVSALVKQMQGLARQAHAAYAGEVDAVIRSRSRDPQRIERLLDGILDFCFDPDMLQLFKTLCRHYYAIDPAATAFYVHAYRDMWDSEEKQGEDTRKGAAGTDARRLGSKEAGGEARQGGPPFGGDRVEAETPAA